MSSLSAFQRLFAHVGIGGKDRTLDTLSLPNARIIAPTSTDVSRRYSPQSPSTLLSTSENSQIA
jgi:hypothetical protein